MTKEQQHLNTVNIVISLLYLLAKIKVFAVLALISDAGIFLESVPLLRSYVLTLQREVGGVCQYI